MDGNIKKKSWKQDPEAVKKDILKVATKEISHNGLAGSRINIIAEKSNTSKRMIYYYFKDKIGLYKAVLESTYSAIRESESKEELTNLNPIEALEKLIEFTFIHHKNNPDFINLIMVENIHNSPYLKTSEIIKDLNAPAIKRVEEIYNKGLKENLFKEGLDPLEIHWFISSFSFFNVSNKSSFTAAFSDELFEEKKQKEILSHIKEMILNFVKK